jgi:hypothetical protein
MIFLSLFQVETTAIIPSIRDPYYLSINKSIHNTYPLLKRLTDCRISHSHALEELSHLVSARSLSLPNHRGHLCPIDEDSMASTPHELGTLIAVVLKAVRIF